MIECIELLKGHACPDLLENSLELSERMLVVAGVAAGRPDAAAMCRRALGAGAALDRLRAIIERQGGDPRVIDDYALMPRAPHEHVMRAEASGFVTDLDAGLIGRAVVGLGGGRNEVEDEIDPGVGVMIAATVGDAVRTGDPVLRVRYRSQHRLDGTLPLLKSAVRIEDAPRPASALVLDEVM